MPSYMMLAIVCLVAKATGNYDQKYFKISGGYKVVNVLHQFKDVSVNECATKCMSYAREGSCKMAGYDLNSQTCQLAADSITVENSESNTLIIKLSDMCGLPAAPDNGQVVISSDRKIADFSCNNGYALNGTGSLQCLLGTWDGEIPTCVTEPVSGCPALSLPENGDYFGNVTGYAYNDMATLFCLVGYEPTVPSITCQANGQWESVSCVLVCGLPAAPGNGQVEVSSGLKIANFSCNNGYTLNGTESLQCINGLWDGDIPTCITEPVSGCPSPSMPVNGDYIGNVTGLAYNDTASVICLTGYAPTIPSITCQANGQWESVSCVFDCGPQLETDYMNVLAAYPSGTLDGANATVTCAPGHRSESGLSSWAFLCDTAHNGWTTFQAPDCVWELMFRGTAENGYNVTDAFLFGDTINGVTSEEGCMDVYNGSCLLNYRNSKVDQWNSLNIDEVLYELYDSTSSVLEVKFDGSGSTINSWFSTSTVLSHPWNIPSLTDTWWDLNGPTDITYGRSFRMTAGYNIDAVTCADHYYTVVFYPPVWTCSYDDFSTYPQFTYSTSPDGSIYETQIFQTARAMGIWVKYH